MQENKCSRLAAAWGPTSRSSPGTGRLSPTSISPAGTCRLRRRTSGCAGSPAGSCTTTPRRCRSRHQTFDLVYSTAFFTTHRTRRGRSEMLRVLKPGGRAIVMVYAENSLQYWRNLVWYYGMKERRSREPFDGRDHVADRRTDGQRRAPAGQGLHQAAASRAVPASPTVRSSNAKSRPSSCLARLRLLLPVVERLAGWNLIIKARKPRRLVMLRRAGRLLARLRRGDSDRPARAGRRDMERRTAEAGSSARVGGRRDSGGRST